MKVFVVWGRAKLSFSVFAASLALLTSADLIWHHSGAILMCRESDISDGELRALCNSIEEGQRGEIEQMKREAEGNPPG